MSTTRRQRTLGLLAVLLAVVSLAILLGRGSSLVQSAVGPVRATPQIAAGAPSAEAGDGIVVINLGERVREWTIQRAAEADTSQTLYSSPRATVHMHALGFGQMTPLHIHRRSEEVAIVVGGTPHVTQVHAREGRLEFEQREAREGDLFYSPTFCGHEWSNRSGDQLQANLVISVPGFDGNLYVKPDDARLLRGGAPRVFEPAESVQSFVASEQPARWLPLGILGDKLGVLLVRRGYALASSSGPTLLYCVSGRGELQSPRRKLTVERQTLVMIPPSTPLELSASGDAPLVAYVLRP